uniref:Uncharacterized protein n=1 Tax=Rhipicephalus appendiculatus TaxID=34631 RepID=A0A131YVS6_RHIAP
MPKAPKARKKILLAAPVSTRWPTIDDEGRSRLLERFRSMTAPLDPTKLSYLVLGLNGAARALEQDQLSVLLLNSSADPPRLLHGLIKLARNKNTPVLCASELHEWVPSVRILLALGLRRTAPATKSVDDFLKAVRLNAGTYPDKASGNDSTLASKNQNETVDKPCAEVTSAVPVGRVSEPSVRVEGKTSEIEEASAPFSEEAAFTKTKDTYEVQLGIVSSETCATEGRGASSVAVDIELPEEGGLGFPDYDFDSVVEVVESPSCAPQKTKAVAVPRTVQASCLVKANIKQVLPKGKTKAKKKRGIIKAIK